MSERLKSIQINYRDHHVATIHLDCVFRNPFGVYWESVSGCKREIKLIAQSASFSLSANRSVRAICSSVCCQFKANVVFLHLYSYFFCFRYNPWAMSCEETELFVCTGYPARSFTLRCGAICQCYTVSLLMTKVKKVIHRKGPFSSTWSRVCSIRYSFL